MADLACDGCLADSWLVARLAAHLEPVRGRIASLLALDSDALLSAIGGERLVGLRDEFDTFDPSEARNRIRSAGLEAVCRCDPAYPVRLQALEAPPPVLYVAGGLARFLELVGSDAVAIVGARRASGYGIEVARSLGRGLGAAGLTVVSGMALGVDCASHDGALAARGSTVAVLPAGAERPYPRAKRSLHREICNRGAVVSELPPASDVWRWMFPARNRVIAGLCAMTIVIEGRTRSGSLLTARVARGLGRLVGAVPGRITSPLAAGPNGLLAAGCHVIRGPEDVLELLFDGDAKTRVVERRPPLEPALERLLAAIGDGLDTAGALTRAGIGPGEGLAALASLEIAGYVRRELGGRFAVVP